MARPTDDQVTDVLLKLACSGLHFFYRDSDLSDELLDKYQVGMVIRERAYIDASCYPGGLLAKHRYLIATNKAVPIFLLEPKDDTGLVVLPRDSHFKVLDS